MELDRKRWSLFRRLKLELGRKSWPLIKERQELTGKNSRLLGKIIVFNTNWSLVKVGACSKKLELGRKSLSLITVLRKAEAFLKKIGACWEKLKSLINMGA